MSNLKDDLPPEIRNQSDLIEDGVTDEIEALEALADEKERQTPPGGLPESDEDKAEPAPETL
jgi:hypothetical protein